MSAIDRWRRMVEEEQAQADRVKEVESEDQWEHFTAQYTVDPYRQDDPLLERLAQGLTPTHTVLDVGAGAGRFSLPLALRCDKVMAVEPSPSMVSALRQQAAQYAIHNVFVVEATWQEAEIEPADRVICAHVPYFVKDIAPFVQKLDGHAREEVLVLLNQDAPQTHYFPFWSRVHKEERLRLPGAPEFQEVLRELGISPRVERLPPQPRIYPNRQTALEQMMRRLFLRPDSPKRRLLEEALNELLEERAGGCQIRGVLPFEPTVLSWKPAERA